MREVSYNQLYSFQDIRMERATQRKLLRQIQIRNQILFFMALSIIILLSVFIIAGFGTQASTEGRAEYKYFRSIDIKSGDSLWSIATEYTENSDTSIKEYVKEVKEINHLEDNTIKAGQKIIVPYYSNEFKQ